MLEFFSVAALIPTLQLILDPNLFLNSKYFQIINNFTFLSDFLKSDNILYYFLVLFFFIIFFKNVGMILLNYINNIVIIGIETKISINLFNKYINSSLIFLSQRRSSEIIRNVISQASAYANNFIHSIVIIITEVVCFSFLLGILFYTFPKETVYSISIFIPISILYVLVFKKIIIKLSQSSENSYEKRIRYLNYGIESAKEIKLYNLQEQFSHEYLKSCYRIMSNLKIISIVRILPRHFFEIVATLMLCIFIIFSVENNIKSEVLLSKISVFAYAAFRILPSINKVLTSVNRFKMSIPVVNNILNELKVLKSDFNKENLQDYKNHKNFNNFKNLTIKGLTFKYPNSKNYVFENLDLIIKRGASNFIYGPSGSGKTTLAEIVIGLINSENKKIFIDNFDLKENKKQWQSIISYVPQDVFLMDDTLKNNIVGNINSKFRKNDYQKVIKLSELELLDKKYDLSTIGEGGKKLSFGQRKRIAVARAIYKKNTEILIFDEATSNLDKESELAIINKIIKLSNNFTIVFISHNMSLSKYFNNVFKIQNKQIFKC